MIRAGQGLAVLALGWLVAACSVPPVPDDSYYRLGALPGEQVVFQQPPFAGSLLIELPRAAGIRRQRGILYSDDTDHVELKRYHYHFWEDAPPQMLHRRLIERLRAAAVAPAITERLTVQADYRLRCHIRRFERDVDGDRVHAVVEIDLIVFAGDAGEAALFRGSYVHSEPATSLRMIDTARAFSRAVDGAIDSFLRELSQNQ